MSGPDLSKPLRLFLIAGEESGDRLGGALMRALQAASPRPIEFIGVVDCFLYTDGAAFGINCLRSGDALPPVVFDRGSSVSIAFRSLITPSMSS